MSEHDPSFGLACHYALLAAANASGVMAERYKDDPTHPERVATYQHFLDCEDRMKRWIVAVERVMDREVLILPGGPRAGDGSRVKVMTDDSTATVNNQRSGYTTSPEGRAP